MLPGALTQSEHHAPRGHGGGGRLEGFLRWRCLSSLLVHSFVKQACLEMLYSYIVRTVLINPQRPNGPVSWPCPREAPRAVSAALSFSVSPRAPCPEFRPALCNNTWVQRSHPPLHSCSPSRSQDLPGLLEELLHLVPSLTP